MKCNYSVASSLTSEGNMLHVGEYKTYVHDIFIYISHKDAHIYFYKLTRIEIVYFRPVQSSCFSLQEPFLVVLLSIII